MASVNWEKYKLGTEVKAHFRHNEQVKRQATREHSNADIDTTRTHLNFACAGRSYEERCAMYDNAVQLASEREYVQEYVVKKGKHAGETKTRKTKGLKKDAVTCLGLETSAPAELSETDAKAWFMRVHKIMQDVFGVENVIDTDVHFDEVHEYTDPSTHERVVSRIHSHTNVLPITEDGRMCAKEICCRSNMVKLNNAIDEMSQREFGIKFNTGEYAKKKSVEQLKGESLKAENEKLSEKVSALVDIAEKAPKRKKFAFGEEQYTMSKSEHDEYIQMCEEMRTMSQNALAIEEDKKATAKAKGEAEKLKREAERMKRQQEQLIEQRAREIAREAVKRAEKREQEADDVKENARKAYEVYVANPFKEFCERMKSAQVRKVTQETIARTLIDLQGLSCEHINEFTK